MRFPSYSHLMVFFHEIPIFDGSNPMESHGSFRGQQNHGKYVGNGKFYGMKYEKLWENMGKHIYIY